MTLTYGHHRVLADRTFDQTVADVTEALAAEGFGVLTEIDVKETLKKKLDVDTRRYRILGACNPEFARQALEVEPHVGLLMPCNVVVQETDGGAVDVSVVDASAMFQFVKNAALEPLAAEVNDRLRRALDRLG